MSLFRRRGKLPPPDSVPRHIAIVMDGNGRWASRRGLPRAAGHAAGAETFRRIATHCRDIGVGYLTVYAFSTENWKRPEDEVSQIFSLLEKYLAEAAEKMERDKIRLRILGDTSVLSSKLRRMIADTELISSQYTGFQANICVNYGARDEILRAAESFVRAGDAPTEEAFSAALYSGGIPDPDLLIRPGGETRLSNFLLWQLAYAELYFTDILWPDFTPDDLNRAVAAYNGRTRRFGGI
ncbi:MAG: di-trans,poly-cis-decaprenylcistransferase [Oscillospiraceae bacterium]|jgi:undecaprenyl diphosphate synthase|nr:di-trans,poly-cis-decaprenylcistransferase [Oscillospiraceae bacterium]